MPDRDQWLNQQSIERLVSGLTKIQCGEVDLLIPGNEQPVVNLEPCRELRTDADARPSRPTV
jgi:hypothetical protein